MSISSISGSTVSSGLSIAQSRADETTQQLAAQGDPAAMQKLKQEQEQQDATSTPGAASEPGKGEQLDRYL